MDIKHSHQRQGRDVSISTTDKETDRHRRGKLGLRTDVTDHPSHSLFSSPQTRASASSSPEGLQTLKVTPEGKTGTILGSAITT